VKLEVLLLGACVGFLTTAFAAIAEGAEMEVKVWTVERPAREKGNEFHVGNRGPLTPSPLMKLPSGNITPKGWLRHQLELMAEGMVGHLPELSKFCKHDSGWWNFESRGWEELPYWIKGFGDLAYVLKNGRGWGGGNKPSVKGSQVGGGYQRSTRRQVAIYLVR